ncbi:MAG TPA: hypothetical protein VFZ08_00145 [Terriglobia bacterium]|nr:hypothetical protein [Terriglobia bacterium]
MEKWADVNPRNDSGDLLCIATFLPLKSWRDLIPFFRMSLRIERQLKRSPALVRYSLRTDLPHKRFWTLSLWNERGGVNTFVSAEPHATAVRRFEKWAGPGAAFVEWTVADKAPGWPEALEKLQTPTFYYQAAG